MEYRDYMRLPDGSYPVSHIQYYFKYNLEKHGTATNNTSIMIYKNKIENRITFKTKTDIILNF